MQPNDEDDGWRIVELSVVVLAHWIEVDGCYLLKGAQGTVVAAYNDDDLYEVEFDGPFDAVVILGRCDLTA